MKRFLGLWPYAILLAIAGLIAVMNYQPGTWLTGWDNLHPEFDFAINIRRSFYAVWQEYQSLGLLGGMGHAAALPRELFLLVLSIIIPNDMLRHVYLVIMLAVGSIGTYILLTKGVFSRIQNGHVTLQARMAGLLGAIFYLCNLATVQMYYIPFEAFTSHYAALPWLFYTSLQFWFSRTRRHFVWLVIVLLLASTQAYIPTLFVVTMIALTTIMTVLVIGRAAPRAIVRTLQLYAIIVLVNAYWLVPFLYFTFTNVGVNVNAKINQMATETIVAQNREFGGLVDVALLKGFTFNLVDYGLDQQPAFMMADWQTHTEQIPVIIIGLTLFGLVLSGFVVALSRRKSILVAFAALFLVSFTVLAIATPPFSWISFLLRNYVPLFNQIFRFPFTKFSLLTALSYSVLFSVAMWQVMTWLTKIRQTKTMARLALEMPGKEYKTHQAQERSVLTIVVVALIGILAGGLLLFYTNPMVNGKLIYEKEQLAIPPEYSQLFAFFKSQGQATRIANFPQHTFWGWNFYDWGYGGSGFLWYGIRQPILDRAFDVWSKEAENYYFELSQAVYAKDAAQFERVLQKYHVSWLLVDRNVINPAAPQVLFYDELEAMIGQNQSIEKAQMFGKITVYRVNLTPAVEQFVSVTELPPTVNRYSWDNDDRAYSLFGTYIAHNGIDRQYTFPFRSLFSLKTTRDKTFVMREDVDTITITGRVPALPERTTLRIPAYMTSESMAPATFLTRIENGRRLIIMQLSTPEIQVNDQKVAGETVDYVLFRLLPTTSLPLTLVVNGSGTLVLDETNTSGVIGSSRLTTKADNSVSLASANGTILETQSVPRTLLANAGIFDERTVEITGKQTTNTITASFFKITDGYNGMVLNHEGRGGLRNCDNFRNGEVIESLTTLTGNQALTLQARNATACVSHYIPSLDHDQAYALFVESQNERGRGLHVWVLNEDEKQTALDTFIPEQKRAVTASFILPPMEHFGKAYSLHLESVSIGDQTATNTVGRLMVVPVPYNQLKSLVFTQRQLIAKPVLATGTFTVDHPNESKYIVTNFTPTRQGGNRQLLTLSQSYNAGWRAYAVPEKTTSLPVISLIYDKLPFLFGTSLGQHVTVNNWANGWVVTDPQTLPTHRIVIVYLPQVLQFAGFGLLILLFIGMATHWLRIFGVKRGSEE